MSTGVYVLIMIGLFFILLSGIGLVRMPTFLTRCQVASKASTLGTVFILLGSMLHFQSLAVVIKVAFIVLFLLLSTPIAMHSLALVAKKKNYD